MNSLSVFLDPGTLRDLEIVPTATTRGTTLWSLVDRTRTRTGRAALRARLLAPPRAADEIVELQRAHQVLAAESDAYRAALDRADADGVERYLNVTWQLPCDMPRLIRARRWYRQYVQDVEDGRTRVAGLLQAAGELRTRLGRADSDVLQTNMAGKSTFLRAVAIAVLLAHAGRGVPAVSMEFPTVGTVFSSVHIADNLSGGESFYLAEVRRIATLAVALAEHGSAVAVVDEPFRGTNVHDAAEATLALISRLADHPAALVLVASHVAEVAPAIVDDQRIALRHFAADMSADAPRFDYRLRDGVSAQRLGMALLRQERVLDLLEQSVRSADARTLE